MFWRVNKCSIMLKLNLLVDFRISPKIKAHVDRCCGVIFICAVYKLFNMFAGFQT